MAADIGGQKQLKKLKAAIIQVKKELTVYGRDESIGHSLLFGLSGNKHGVTHHLYDDIYSTQIKDDEFNL